MRLIINSNDRISGNSHNFQVELKGILPEEINLDYQVFIKQVIIHSATDMSDDILYLCSSSIVPYSSEYNTRYNNTLCFVENVGFGNFSYKNQGNVEDFSIKGLNPIINFNLSRLTNQPIINDDWTVTIILNLVK